MTTTFEHIISRVHVWLILIAIVIPGAGLAAEPDQISFAATTDHDGKAVTLTGELHKPEGSGPFPAVVLMHGCGGLQPAVRHALRQHAEHLLRHGFVALALDSFGPRNNGDGWVCKTFGRLAAARRYRTADALDAAAHLRSLPFVSGDNIFQMGQSNGASVSLRLAQLKMPEFRAAAAYYPWCGALTHFINAAKLTSPLIVLSGAKDDWTPPGACQALQAKGADYKIVVYPNAVHSFDLEFPVQKYQGHLVGYDRKATADSRRQMLAFFKKHMTPAMMATLPPVPAAGQPTQDFLSGADITQLMPTGPLKGINGYGEPYTITYLIDGAMSGVAGKSNEYKDTGKWWVKENRFCRQYTSWLAGKAACFKVTLEGDTISFFDAEDGFVSSGIFAR